MLCSLFSCFDLRRKGDEGDGSRNEIKTMTNIFLCSPFRFVSLSFAFWFCFSSLCSLLYLTEESELEESINDGEVVIDNDEETNPPITNDWLLNSPTREKPTPDDAGFIYEGRVTPPKARKQSRKDAIPLRKEELHYLNLPLLSRFVQANGMIMGRQESQLSAKDQRKVAKLIKTARHMGIIPHVGPWTFEDSGTAGSGELEKMFGNNGKKDEVMKGAMEFEMADDSSTASR
jgi:ribosomal protein S18